MSRLVVKMLGTAAVGAALVATGGAQQAPAPSPSSSPAPAPAVTRAAAPVRPSASHGGSPALSARQQTALVTQYCTGCHSDRAKAGGLSLAGFDAMKAQQQPEVVEKMIRKMSAGLMPPPGAKKPDVATLDALTAALETRMDERAASNPNPGRRTFQRLNRPECGARFASCSTSTSRPATDCRSTRRAPTSTTSPTSSRCRRPCSRPT
ncbi:MAG: c-type cytochrome domain-containing protein [Vicinamibacterales bacterium]